MSDTNQIHTTTSQYTTLCYWIFIFVQIWSYLIDIQSQKSVITFTQGCTYRGVNYRVLLPYLGSKITTTRTTRTPAFWGYPPPPRDYPYYWPFCFESQVHTTDQFISDPKSKEGESRKKIEKFAKNLNFSVTNLTRNTPSNGSDYLWQIWK